MFEAHGPMVFALCNLILRDRQEAEDALQQTFLSGYRSMLEGTVPEEPTVWLTAIARNECLSRLRRRAPRLVSLRDDHLGTDEDVADVIDRRTEITALSEAIAGLPPAQRQAVILRDFYGLSYREVSAVLGLSGPAVESLLFRSRKRLQEQLQPLHEAGGAAALPVAVREALVGTVPGFSSGLTASGIGAAGAGLTAKIVSTPAAAKIAALALVAGLGSVSMVHESALWHRHGGKAHERDAIDAHARSPARATRTAAADRDHLVLDVAPTAPSTRVDRKPATAPEPPASGPTREVTVAPAHIRLPALVIGSWRPERSHPRPARVVAGGSRSRATDEDRAAVGSQPPITGYVVPTHDGDRVGDADGHGATAGPAAGAPVAVSPPLPKTHPLSIQSTPPPEEGGAAPLSVSGSASFPATRPSPGESSLSSGENGSSPFGASEQSTGARSDGGGQRGGFTSGGEDGPQFSGGVSSDGVAWNKGSDGSRTGSGGDALRTGSGGYGSRTGNGGEGSGTGSGSEQTTTAAPAQSTAASSPASSEGNAAAPQRQPTSTSTRGSAGTASTTPSENFGGDHQIHGGDGFTTAGGGSGSPPGSGNGRISSGGGATANTGGGSSSASGTTTTASSSGSSGTTTTTSGGGSGAYRSGGGSSAYGSGDGSSSAYGSANGGGSYTSGGGGSNGAGSATTTGGTTTIGGGSSSGGSTGTGGGATTVNSGGSGSGGTATSSSNSTNGGGSSNGGATTTSTGSGGYGGGDD